MVAGSRSTLMASGPWRATGFRGSFKASALGSGQIGLGGYGAVGEIPGGDLGLDLDLGIGRHQLVGDLHPLADLDATAGDRVVLVVAHAHQAVDLADAQPVQHIGHQLLKTHVLHPRHTLGAQEVLVGAVAPYLPLAGVVDEELGDLAERSALLAAVGDQAHPAGLRAPDAFFDRVGQVGAAGADVAAEHVRAIAFIVHPRRQRHVRIGQVARVAEDVERLPPDGRQKHFDVAARHQLGVHATGLLEQRAAQLGLVHLEALGHPGQPPHRLHRDLGDGGRAVFQQDAAIHLQALEGQRLLDLGQVDVGLGDGDRRADVVALGQVVLEHALHRGAPGVDRHHLLGVAPLRVGADQVGRRGVGEVGPVALHQVAGGHGQGAVHPITAAVAADHVALAAVGGAAHHRAALQGRGRAPVDGRRAAGALLAGVGGQADVFAGRIGSGGCRVRWDVTTHGNYLGVQVNDGQMYAGCVKARLHANAVRRAIGFEAS